MFVDRPYQTEAKQAGLNKENSILVLPTGSGKSLVCAGLVNQVDGGVLVLQPSLEILNSNIAKAHSYGMNAKIYSASAGKKEISRITYATIGSIIKKLELFSHVKTLVIDECHLVNAKGGMYEKLIDTLPIDRLIGMTATPYRQATSSWGTAMRIQTRTRPKIFKDISYVVNPRELVNQGYLLEPEYIPHGTDQSMLKSNTTGAEYSEQSRRAYTQKNDLKRYIVKVIMDFDKDHILVFAETVADSQEIVMMLNELGITAAEINAKTPKPDRRKKLERFESGDIRVMVNVGTLTTGYDFPALDGIVDGAPTMSAALHYQKIGRVVRPYPDKTAVVHDVAGNVARLGNPINYTLRRNATGLYELYSERGRVTTRIMSDGPECETDITFGKYGRLGAKLKDVDGGYVEWAARDMKGEWRHIFYSEMVRREIIDGKC